MKWRRGWFLGLMIALLTGCASGTAHVTVHKNGSIDIAAILRLDARTESLISGKLEDKLSSRLEEAGVQLRKSQDGNTTEYQFQKSYASMQEMRETAGNWDMADTKVHTKEQWFYTKYAIEAKPKLNVYSEQLVDSMGSLNVPKPLVRLLMQRFAIDFKLTLPFDVFGDNNAAEQDGRTLTWHISLADSDPIRLEIYVPNIRNIAIAGGIVIAALITAVIFFIRKRRSRKSKRF